MKLSVALLCVLFATSACSSSPALPEGAAVRIKEGHFHTRYCGHYLYGTQWYFIAQHRHGVDCGHEKIDGDWILPED